MSKKKKLVFHVGTGLAVTALALGTGCPKDRPEDVNVNTVPSPPATNANVDEQPESAPSTNNDSGTNNGTNGTTNTTGGLDEPPAPPDRVNTIPSDPPE